MEDIKIIGNVYCTDCDKHILRCECRKGEVVIPENKMVDAENGKNESSKKIVKK